VVEVKDNRVVCLADSAEPVSEIDATRAENAGERARNRIRERKPDTDLDRARLALERSTNRLKLSRRG
jgi:F-type H+-transporting ATPase subunit epsilon